MSTRKLLGFLDERRIKYLIIRHSAAYTSQELAEKTHIQGWDIAKATLLRVDGRYVMAVLPAPMHVDFKRVAKLLHARTVELAPEADLRSLFPDCEMGAIPPFGNLYQLPVLLDTGLTADETIVCNAGTHSEALRLEFRDYRRLTEPQIGEFAVLQGR